jgi:phosphoserine phosphatase
VNPGPPFHCILFDCDSTLSAVEGIDQLAVWAGVGEQVAALTSAAMDGELSLEQVYGRRLALLQPDEQQIKRLGEEYIARVVPGAQETLATLHALGKSVHIVSGGIRQAVLMLARELALPEANVHAVDLRFDTEGRYAGFDEQSPLARSGGKAQIARELIRQFGPSAIVGDGVTDLEAAEAGCYVVGFGGIAAREVMRRGAAVFIEGTRLTGVLAALLTREEWAKAGGRAAHNQSG